MNITKFKVSGGESRATNIFNTRNSILFFQKISKPFTFLRIGHAILRVFPLYPISAGSFLNPKWPYPYYEKMTTFRGVEQDLGQQHNASTQNEHKRKTSFPFFLGGGQSGSAGSPGIQVTQRGLTGARSGHFLPKNRNRIRNRWPFRRAFRAKLTHVYGFLLKFPHHRRRGLFLFRRAMKVFDETRQAFEQKPRYSGYVQVFSRLRHSHSGSWTRPGAFSFLFSHPPSSWHP